jgi:CubicO group peptidase (beta-lactamase class C family)
MIAERRTHTVKGGQEQATEEMMMRAEKVGMSSERLARIRPAVAQHIGDDKIAGAVLLVARRGEVVYETCIGPADRERGIPMQPDTLFRIYSMTKPITAVAVLMLFEQGLIRLTDPVAAFIPAFSDLKVSAGGSASDPELVDLQRPVTVHDLLTHTSGMTYHIFEYGAVEQMYRDARLFSHAPLPELVAQLAQLPLAFQLGARWRYSMSYEVVARWVEIVSGQAYDVFLRDSLFAPLGMVDTGFYVPEEKLERFAALYGAADFGEPDVTLPKLYEAAMAGVNKRLADPRNCLESAPHDALRGGHGLVSTAPDYLRFCRMLLNGGELDGVRILGRKTVELMTTNHLAPELLPYELGGQYSPGMGYGLGVGVLMDPAQARVLGSAGACGWSGIAATNFRVDPKEELVAIQMSQSMSPGFYPIAADFWTTVYQAIVD